MHFFLGALRVNVHVRSGESQELLNSFLRSKPESFKCCSHHVAMVGSSELLAKLELEDLNLILRERRLCWFGAFGHVKPYSGAVRTACDIQIDGERAAGTEVQANTEETDRERLP